MKKKKRTRWSRESIRATLVNRLAEGRPCSVTALRKGGLGALYNAALREFRSDFDQLGRRWDRLVRLLAGDKVTDQASLGRPRVRTYDDVVQELKELYDAGVDLTPGRMMRERDPG